MDKQITVTQAYRILKTAAISAEIDNLGTNSLRKTGGYWIYKASRYNIGLIMDTFNHNTHKIDLRCIGIHKEAKDLL